MQAPKAIVVNALSRGGSNILWNILQSHPLICSPMRETGVLFIENVQPFCLLPPNTAKRIATWPVVHLLARAYLLRVFEQWKRRNYQCPNNGTKYEGVPYSLTEVEESIICFKGVDSDVHLNPLFDTLYGDGDVAYIALVRNGYAVCNGWMRRGMNAESAGRKYASIVRRMLAKQETCDTFLLIKFEDVMRDPFGTAERIFQAIGVKPTKLSKLRLKSKRVLTQEGEHQIRFGEEGGKYWVAPSEIGQVLDAGIDCRQQSSLNRADRLAFEGKAQGTLVALGYWDDLEPTDAGA